eukprot:4033008-Prymnesium_polylepis.1
MIFDQPVPTPSGLESRQASRRDRLSRKSGRLLFAGCSRRTVSSHLAPSPCRERPARPHPPDRART